MSFSYLIQPNVTAYTLHILLFAIDWFPAVVPRDPSSGLLPYTSDFYLTVFSQRCMVVIKHKKSATCSKHGESLHAQTLLMLHFKQTQRIAVAGPPTLTYFFANGQLS